MLCPADQRRSHGQKGSSADDAGAEDCVAPKAKQKNPSDDSTDNGGVAPAPATSRDVCLDLLQCGLCAGARGGRLRQASGDTHQESKRTLSRISAVCLRVSSEISCPSGPMRENARPPS